MKDNRRVHIDILDEDGCVVATAYAIRYYENERFLELAKQINEYCKDACGCEFLNTDDIDAYESEAM